jgi:alkylated DNA repair dioxygenase AlkB
MRARRHNRHVSQQELFGARANLPSGFVYAAQFVDVTQEARLIEIIRTLPFKEAQYKQWQARRRVVSFGGRYDFTRNELTPAPPIPDFLLPLRAQLAHWAGLEAECIGHAMIAEYQPGTPLGWHRDVPQFESIAGVSLQGHARLRFRPWPPKPAARTQCAIELEPRSAYVLQGAARWSWQHALSPTKELRYSVTFRTRRL